MRTDHSGPTGRSFSGWPAIVHEPMIESDCTLNHEKLENIKKLIWRILKEIKWLMKIKMHNPKIKIVILHEDPSIGHPLILLGSFCWDMISRQMKMTYTTSEQIVPF